jgi:hypothetical protein
MKDLSGPLLGKVVLEETCIGHMVRTESIKKFLGTSG